MFRLVLLLTSALTVPAAAHGRHPEQTVIASFYGHPYHGRRAADGSRFDRMAATAAHRTLPFGTRARVTFGGRSEVVTITDRGPFIPGRDLDLSEGTAMRLGLHTRGVAPVRLRVLR